MHIEVILEVALAVFAIYGIFCAVQLLIELFFPCSSFTIAVFAREGESINDIYKRLCYAQLIAARERGSKAYPIIIAESEDQLEELKKLGVAVYTAKEI